MTIEANFPDSNAFKPIVFADGKTWPFTVFLNKSSERIPVLQGRVSEP